jgi:hypothetical protein
MMRKSIVGAAICAAAVLSVGTSVFAGEVTGKGRGGPNGDGIPGSVEHGRSECLYSGLEDFDGEQPAEPGVVQNWGHTKDAPIVLDSRGASWVLLVNVFGIPDVETVELGCNAHNFPHEESPEG